MSTEPANEPEANEPEANDAKLKDTKPAWVTPVSVFVVSHPDCKESSTLADGLHRWLRLMDGPEAAPEAGLPVWYRRRVEGTGEDARLSPPVNYDEARLTVVVVLCSDPMPLDNGWIDALNKLPAAPKAGEASEKISYGAPYGLIIDHISKRSMLSMS